MCKIIDDLANLLRYDHLAMMAAITKEPNSRHCINAACNSGQVHESGHDQPIITCSACQTKACFTHVCFWHEGQKCTDYEKTMTERRAQEVASEATLAKEAKVCPNKKCGIHLQKSSGCDHFTCEYAWSEVRFVILMLSRHEMQAPVLLDLSSSIRAYICAW